MVIWLVGLSGSGKTTLGKILVERWKNETPAVVFIDGDVVRQCLAPAEEASDYSISGRRRNALRIVALCQWLDQQGIHVVCSILAIFPDILLDNRSRFSSYREVFLSPSRETLYSRDTKGLYQSALAGRTSNVVGIDIDFPRPPAPDLEFDTGNPLISPQALVEKMIAVFKIIPQP
jgi:adenylylsulfate kinase-like enzyme